MTLEKSKTLSDEELRIKAAELDEWEEIHFAPEYGDLWGNRPEYDEGKGEGWDIIPDYLNDIEAAWRLWQIAKSCRFWDFCRYLRRLADSEDFTTVMDNLSPDLITRAFVLAMA